MRKDDFVIREKSLPRVDRQINNSKPPAKGSSTPEGECDISVQATFKEHP